MPTYPLAFPAAPVPTSIKIGKVWAVARFDNPVQLSTQVQLRSAKRYEIDVTLPKMPADDAANWGAFLDGLQGGFGTFSLNLTPHCPGVSPAPGTRHFRLATDKHGWDSQLATEFGFAFTAIEDV